MTVINLKHRVKYLYELFFRCKQVSRSYLAFILIALSSSLLFVLLSKKQISYINTNLNKDHYNELIEIKTTTSTSDYANAKQVDNHRSRVENLFSWSNEHNIWTIDDIDNNSKKKVFIKNIKDDHKTKIVWPEEYVEKFGQQNDRIINQLLLSERNQFNNEKIFKIYPPNDQSYPTGNEVFFKHKCLINKCEITYDKDSADALIYLNSDVIDEPLNRNINQIWIAYLLESPPNTFDKRFKRHKRGNHLFNWTASYRIDSDIVTPYSKFVPYASQLKNYLQLSSNNNKSDTKKLEKINVKTEQDIDSTLLFNNFNNLLKTKTGKVAWFVSNCNSANNRLQYARELAKHIHVDIYGKCGDFSCFKWNYTGCLDLINKNYKFYLSFENSNCLNYLTEKLFKNAFGYNDLEQLILPIVMGAPKEDYENMAPPASFIHVDDFKSPKELANYLKILDNNDHLYYSYFKWKLIGQFIDTKFMCRVCAMMHNNYYQKSNNLVIKSYDNIKKWWLNYNSKEACESFNP